MMQEGPWDDSGQEPNGSNSTSAGNESGWASFNAVGFNLVSPPPSASTSRTTTRSISQSDDMMPVWETSSSSSLSRRLGNDGDSVISDAQSECLRLPSNKQSGNRDGLDQYVSQDDGSDLARDDLINFGEGGPESVISDQRDGDYVERMQELEQEQEMLNSSLMSLTTHFAQVQFRLKQITSASDPDARERLIKELEVFASEGCPEVRGMPRRQSSVESTDSSANYGKQVLETKELIQRLQRQLTDVEQWAYESGHSEPPSLAVLEKQRLILDTLQEKVKLSIDGYEHLSPEELRLKIDHAVDSILAPYRKKETAQEMSLNNLQTVVDDLERYINHLHREDPSHSGSHPSAVPQNSDLTSVELPIAKNAVSVTGNGPTTSKYSDSKSSYSGTASLRTLAHRSYTLLHFFTLMNLSCLNEKRFRKNEMKTTVKGNHWGDARATLELAISKVLDVTQERAKLKVKKNGRVYNKAEKEILEEQLNKLVRKDLSSALCLLMQHGLAYVNNETSLVPYLVCTRRRTETAELHPWDFILRYYKYKKGGEFHRSATKKLSDSFQLSAVGSKSITPQETLLSTIGDIIDTHEKFKRSSMTKLKALVCAGLNQKSLGTWLKLIYCTQPIVDEFYMLWSYAAKTHFEDACQSLDNLSTFDFCLSADQALKPFNNLSDAF